MVQQSTCHHLDTLNSFPEDNINKLIPFNILDKNPKCGKGTNTNIHGEICQKMEVFQAINSFV